VREMAEVAARATATVSERVRWRPSRVRDMRESRFDAETQRRGG
jgi:hypothetical protein